MCKHSLLSAYIFLLSLHCNAQKIDSLIHIGDSLRNTGNYKQAIEKYQNALVFEKESSLANYEIAYTYLIQYDYKNAINYCNRIIKSDQGKTIEAYIIKGSAFDYMGKQKKSERLYKTAIKKFPGNYLLNYNLGVTYYNDNQLENARNQFLKSIEIDKLQPNSHFMLGSLLNDIGERVQSMLSLYFFLLLEPNTQKSTEAYKMLINLWKQNIEVDSLYPNRLIIKNNTKNVYNEFNSIDLSISSIYAINSRKKKDTNNDYEVLIANTVAFFNLIGSYKEANNDIWHTLYLRFFNDLYNANQVEPFCYYISSTCDDAIINGWLESNKDKIEEFSSWANNRLLRKE